MKTIHMLTNEDKAILMHQLFPGEIEALIQHMEALCKFIIDNQDLHRQKWDDGFMPFDFWLLQITKVQTAIIKDSQKLVKNARYFSEKLFSGMLATYSNHCIDVFIKKSMYRHPKFPVAYELFYRSI